jgi:hypothetical protein
MPGAEGVLPPSATGTTDTTGTPGTTGMAGPAASAFTELASGAGVGSSAALDPGYIDSAVPRTQFRLRFNALYDDNRPDRAEFFYAKCGCFRLVPVAQGGDPSAPGPGPFPETRVDAQEFSAYLEYAASDRLSAFVEFPVRLLNPEQNADTEGFGDMNAGFKYALLANQGQFLTVQFRTFIPTGDPAKGLGTDHVSLEPALLFQQPLGDRLVLFSELRDWIAVGGTDFAGNVIRYGVGLGYRIIDGPKCWLAPVGEVVGWTALSGKELAVAGDNRNVSAIQDAAGDTIVNAKVGVRFGGGQALSSELLRRSDVYIGYGRALTGDVWYKDIIRAEFRLRF